MMDKKDIIRIDEVNHIFDLYKSYSILWGFLTPAEKDYLISLQNEWKKKQG